MKKIHAKSPCCRALVVRFGERRRQCVKCQKTWRVRKKKRGRKCQRVQVNLCLEYLEHRRPPMWAIAEARQVSEKIMQSRLARSRDLFLRQTNWPKLPPGNTPLLAVVDALIFKWLGHYHTCYFILIRRPKDNQAVITPFWLELGKETQLGWRHALDQLPGTIKLRLRAIVCDGHIGPINWAKQHKLLIQRCHFHLLAAVLGRRSRSKWSRHREEGERIWRLVRLCIETKDEEEAKNLVYRIEDEALNTTSVQLRKILRGFVHYYEHYRIYHYYPALQLPTTTNAAESLNACVKDLQYRMRGFATIESFKKWLTAILKFKKRIKCKGKNQPN